jgi:outer membrane protein assembly factor BamB
VSSPFIEKSLITNKQKHAVYKVHFWTCKTKRRKRKMQIDKAKIAAIIAIVLMMSSITSMAMQVQPAEGQLAAQQPVAGPLPAGVTVDATASGTKMFLSFRPNPIGVNQLLLINMWCNPALASNQRYFPKAYVLTITKPDGTKDVLTLDSEPATTATWMEYVPDQAGEWTLKVDFLGCYFPAGRYYNGYVVTNSSGTLYGSAYYPPCSTEEQVLTVQQDYVLSWPPSPLPTDYWTRPVSPEHREWWPILGSWPAEGYLGGGSMWDELYPNTNPYGGDNHWNFYPWVQGPNSAHIVWKRQGSISGITGGPAGIYSIASSPGGPNVIYAGRCYQTVTKPGVGSVAQCYDLRTGEIYYEIPTADGGVTPTYVAYLPPTPTTTQHEVLDVMATGTWSVELIAISGSNLYKVNPYTGAVSTYSIAPLSGGTFWCQIDGFVLNVQDLGAAAGENRYRLINWTTRGSSSTLASRIISNTSYARSSLPTFLDFSTATAAICPDHLPYGLSARYGAHIEIYDLWTGVLRFNVTLQHPDTIYSMGGSGPLDHGLMAMWTQRGYFVAVDIYTGNVKWRSEVTEYPWAESGFGAYSVSSGYGLIVYSTYAGIYAFNWTDGSIAWNFRTPSYAAFESPYIEDGQELYPFRCQPIIADGKVYVWNMEHTESYPLTRGWGTYCVNATTGELIWHLMIGGDSGIGALADGYAVLESNREGYMYVIGRGKSATTVSAPDVSVPLGTAFTIKGSVLDMSPAQAGTPCVSKDSMSTQMEYLHKQMPIDGLWHNESITGVPVSLTAIGSDGSVYDLGSVTTNGYYGTFGMSWTPPAEGTYEVIASFAADDSYGSSAASTMVTVGPAPAPIQFPEQTAPADYTLTIVGAAVAIIIAVVIAVAAAVLILRKR